MLSIYGTDKDDMIVYLYHDFLIIVVTYSYQPLAIESSSFKFNIFDMDHKCMRKKLFEINSMLNIIQAVCVSYFKMTKIMSEFKLFYILHLLFSLRKNIFYQDFSYPVSIISSGFRISIQRR